MGALSGIGYRGREVLSALGFCNPACAIRTGMVCQHRRYGLPLNQLGVLAGLRGASRSGLDPERSYSHIRRLPSGSSC